MSNPLIIRDENGKLIHSMVPKEDMRKTLHECCKRTLRKRFGEQKADDIAEDMAEILFEMCCHLDEFYRTLYKEQEGKK